MRIVSGKYKGRIIAGYQLAKTRPTMDRVKESLFAMLQNNLVGKRCLDLFAGSGNLGLEALSRGALEVVFGDCQEQAIETIKKNITQLKIVEKTTVIKGDYLQILTKLQGTSFAIIFLDPPYKTNYLKQAITKIEEEQLLDKEGLIILESDDLTKCYCPSNYQIFKDRKYGNKYIRILKRRS